MFIVNKLVAARRADTAAPLKGLNVPRLWQGGCRPSSSSPVELRLAIPVLDHPLRMFVLRFSLFYVLCMWTSGEYMRLLDVSKKKREIAFIIVEQILLNF